MGAVDTSFVVEGRAEASSFGVVVRGGTSGVVLRKLLVAGNRGLVGVGLRREVGQVA